MRNQKTLKSAILATSLLALSSASLAQQAISNDSDAQAHKAWRETVMHSATPASTGCFHVSYPSTYWTPVACKVAPNRPFAQWPQQAKQKISQLYTTSSATSQPQTVGDGADYAAKVTDLLTYAVGDFPSVSNVTSETGYLGSNDYTLQLNSNFMSTAACNGHSGCLAWQQFVYSSGEQAVFIQYWLLNYGTCPSGWNTYGDSCWKNSAAASVPQIPIAELSQLSIWANATPGGNDQVGLATGSDKISGSDFFAIVEPDSVLDLGSAWQGAEFNIFGDGGGTSANFNSGASLSVLIQLGEQGGATTLPTCVSNGGTTGETNNLNLSGCSSLMTGGNPSITFTESN